MSGTDHVSFVSGTDHIEGFRVWYRPCRSLYKEYIPVSNPHCDVKSRVVRNTTKVYAFLEEKASPFVVQKYDVVIYS